MTGAHQSLRLTRQLFCSNVHFKVHKANLAMHSPVFGDMLELGSGPSGGLAEVLVTEASEVLELVLPQCYPGRTHPLDATSALILPVARAFHKYEVNHIAC